MVPLMKVKGVITSAVFMIDINRDDKDSDIYFGGVDPDKNITESEISWGAISDGRWWDAPVTKFGYGCVHDLSGTKVIFHRLSNAIYLPPFVF